jgi:predicted DNA-binding protein
MPKVTKLYQRVMGQLPWNVYIRLKTLAKVTGKSVHNELVPEAIQEYLDNHEQRSN